MSQPHRRRPLAAGTIALAILLILAGLLINEFTVAWAIRPGARLQNPSLRIVLALLQILMLGAGALLLARRPRIGGREVLASAASCVIMLAMVELVMRFFVFGSSFDGTLDLVDGLGWTPRPNVDTELALAHFGEVAYETDERGFRRFDGGESDATRVLVIGDSFTHAYHVSHGHSYFDVIAERVPGTAIFAFGAGGYGSLQEYMVLDRYLDVVRPHLIIWQFTSNDLSNNYLPLETVSLENANQQWRPFLIDGRITRRYPSRFQFIGHSYLLRYLAMQYKLFRIARLGEASIEHSFTREHPLYRGAFATTDRILALARARAGSVPMIAFSVDRPQWLGDTFERLAKRNGIQFVEGIPDAIEAARAQGVRVDARPYDGHWTAEGHAIAGELLADHLMRTGWARPTTRSTRGVVAGGDAFPARAHRIHPGPASTASGHQ